MTSTREMGGALNIPGFTAQASLYEPSGHYRTGRHAITSPTPMISLVYPAMKAEEIEVHSCAPGWVDIGGSCWPVPQSESGIPGTPEPFPDAPDPFEAKRKGGPKRGETKKPPRPRRPIFLPKDGGACHADQMYRGTDRVAIIAAGHYYATGLGPSWMCCGVNTVDSVATCITCQNHGYGPCGNGHPCGPSGVDCP
jgi:hypothetical protein